MAIETRSCTIFVGNIPYDASEDDLKEIFGRAGPVASLRLVFDKDTRQPKGYGFCDFTNPDDAVRAIKELSDAEVCGRRLRLDLADNALRAGKGGGKGGGGKGMLSLGDAASSSRPVGGLPPGSLPPGALPPGSLPPDLEKKLIENKDEPSPEAVAAQLSAHTETAHIISSMPKVQLQMCLGAMQRLAEEAPEEARALLQVQPQLCYALLHAQMILGLDDNPSLPADSAEMQQLRIMNAQAQGMPGFAGPGFPGMPPRPLMPGFGMAGMGVPVPSPFGVTGGFGGLTGLVGILKPPVPPPAQGMMPAMMGMQAKASAFGPSVVPPPPSFAPMDLG